MKKSESLSGTVEIVCFFDDGVSKSSTCSYLIIDKATKECAILDAVWDFDQASGTLSSASIDAMLAAVRDQDLKVTWALATHAHADHVDGAKIVKERTGAVMGIGEPIRKVQSTFQEVYNVDAVTPDGSEFDHYFTEGEVFHIGKTPVRVMFTPGHTPGCVSYLVNEEAVFVGDTLFAADAGTARCDFPNGSAAQLYDSVSKLLALPEKTEMFLCHDYQPGGRDLVYRTTVAEQRASNKHVKDGTTKEEYVKMRTERDATLNFPRLLYPSILLNIRGGRLPTPESNGKSYLKTPIQVKTDSAL